MSRDEMSAAKNNENGRDHQLDRIVFIGRTYDEYRRMFRLHERNLVGRKILDCPAGSCSFAAEMGARGIEVVACDIAYSQSSDELASRGEADVAHAIEDVERNHDSYRWDYFGGVGALRYTRMKALNGFLADFRRTRTAELEAETEGGDGFPVDRRRTRTPANSGRYVAAALPALPFADGAFDLILSANFLFLYADRLDLAFHAATLRELMRVAREEIRLFPVVNFSGERYAHMDFIMRVAGSAGFEARVAPVPYEFALGANAMLQLTRVPG